MRAAHTTTSLPLPRRRSARGRVGAALGVLFAAMVLALGVPAPAWAAGNVQVTPTSSLDPDGADIRVQGAGFPEDFGIYVALCVDKGAGQNPTPCVGGADMSGGVGASAWISSNPPPYGEGLAQPYGPGGTFDVTLHVVAVDPITGTDCREVTCVVVTKADHTHAADRSQDTRTAVTFAAAAPPPTTTAAPPPVTTPSTTAPAQTSPTSAAPSETATTTAPTATTTGAPTAPTADVTTTAAAADPADASGATPGWLWPVVAIAVVAAGAVIVWWRRQARTAGAPGPDST